MWPECQSASPRASGWITSRWWMALLGLYLSMFAVVALSGPGRIDIVDGQTRYEVARSLVDHGDHIVRDSRAWFGVFPGRDGQPYTTYRLPQSAVGAAAILLADTTGSQLEARRHFFFTLTSAAACAALAPLYAVFFRLVGASYRSACAWAVAGILCTPSWFYGTSMFDDILGATALVGAVVSAWSARGTRPLLWAACAGLLLGLAFNCKQPLGALAAAVAAACVAGQYRTAGQWRLVGLVVLGLAAGLAAYKGYDLYKFPPGTAPDPAIVARQYGPVFAENRLPGLVSLALSPGAGALWYCPTVVLAAAGLAAWFRREPWFCAALVAGSAVFVVFVASLTFYAGDPAWGPRYLTPLFALWWLLVPAGAARLRRGRVILVLACGMLVQLLGLSVDPHRLYIQRRLPSAFVLLRPWSYFDTSVAHLCQRPREILELCGPRRPPAPEFTPAPEATFALPVIDYMPSGPEAVRRYQVFDSFRPWWVSHRILPPAQRPVDLAGTCVLLACVGLAGLALCLGVIMKIDQPAKHASREPL